jgi:hypothetical protein
MVAVVVLGREQEPAEFTAVHAVPLARLDLRATHALRGVGQDSTVDVSGTGSSRTPSTGAS